jgi:hypothetical protein
MNFLCELTIAIPPLPCLFNMAKVASSMVLLGTSESSDSVDFFNFAMSTVASKCAAMEQWSHVQMVGEESNGKRYI